MQAAKGQTNIPLNEPQLAQAANDAAAAAARRPRPFYKFEQNPGEPQPTVYANDRKLSAGESAGDLFVPPTQAGQEDAQQAVGGEHLLGQDGAGPSSVRVPPLNLVPGTQQPAVDPNLGQVASAASDGAEQLIGDGLPYTYQAGVPGLTPGTVTQQQLRAAWGFQADLPLDQVPGMTAPTTVYHQMTASNIPEVQTGTPLASPTSNVPEAIREANPGQASVLVHSHGGGADPSHATGSIQQAGVETGGAPVSAAVNSATGVAAAEPGSIDEIEPAAIPQHAVDPAYQALAAQHFLYQTTSPTALPGSAATPDSHPAVLQVPGGGYLAGTPSGLNSGVTPSSAEENLLHHMYPRVNFGGTNTSIQGEHRRWRRASTSTAISPCLAPLTLTPLTPFSNFGLFTRAGDIGNYPATAQYGLPSPSNAGLLPITPRGLGFESLLSARSPSTTNENGKRSLEPSADTAEGPNPKRPFQ